MTALKQAVEKAFVFQNEAGIKQKNCCVYGIY